MSNASNWLEAQWIEHLFRGDTFSKVPNLYAGLFLTDPTDGDIGTEITTSGSGYSRQIIPVDNDSWSPPEDAAGYMRSVNLIELEWDQATSEWGTPAYWGLFDAGTGGNLWVYAPIGGTLRSIGPSDDPVSFAPGALIVSTGMAVSNYAETKMLNHMLRDDTFTKLSTIYAALHGSDPNDTGVTGEFDGTGYGRVAISVSDSSWTEPFESGDETRIENENTITFPSVLGNWGAYTHAGFWDSLTGGNLLYAMPFDIVRTVNQGDHAPVYPPGTLSMQIG